MRSFRQAIVRPPAPNFSEGLTTVNLGPPVYKTALKQHEAYCAALQSCGLTLMKLPADGRYPDSTFVEDTAVLTEHCVIITRPGALSRRGEVGSIEEELLKQFSKLAHIEAPGTLDGGDICEADNHFLIGLSERTNEAGARQLAGLLQSHGYSTEIVDVRSSKSILHFKSGVSFLGDNRLVVIEELAGLEALQNYDLVRVRRGEEYSANCIRVNDAVLIAAGFSRLEKELVDRGYQTIALEMSEFQKMDGGLSCLSLRF